MKTFNKLKAYLSTVTKEEFQRDFESIVSDDSEFGVTLEDYLFPSKKILEDFMYHIRDNKDMSCFDNIEQTVEEYLNEKETQQILKGYHEEEIRLQQQEEEQWNRVMHQVAEIAGNEWHDDLMNNVLEYPQDYFNAEILSECKGNVQEADGDIIKEEWVDEWVGGGMSGDEFAGSIYFKLNENQYLKLRYQM